MSENTERDELAEVIRSIDGPATLGGLEVADAILAAGYRKPRTITTVKELDALELRSVVRDRDGEPFELTDNGWRYWMYEESFSSLELSLPATVLHEPTKATL